MMPKTLMIVLILTLVGGWALVYGDRPSGLESRIRLFGTAPWSAHMGKLIGIALIGMAAYLLLKAF